MTDTPMTAGWEPSEEMKRAAHDAMWKVGGLWYMENTIKAVRPLIIAEARPQIEAAERERMKAEMGRLLQEQLAKAVAEGRALKDSKP